MIDSKLPKFKVFSYYKDGDLKFEIEVFDKSISVEVLRNLLEDLRNSDPSFPAGESLVTYDVENLDVKILAYKEVQEKE